MIYRHDGRTPLVDPAAWVAPDATVVGDVEIGAGSRVMHGARIVASDGPIRIGRMVIVMENAVLRSTGGHGCLVGNHCLIGPNTHVVGATVGEEVFVATGAALFHGCWIGKGAEVRINAVVHIRTRLDPGATVPIGWVAVGDPARILPPDAHEQIWAAQAPLHFPLTVYGLDRTTPDLMCRITERLSDRLSGHREDVAELP